MSVKIEALYIYDELNDPILEHIYGSRPPSAQSLIARFISLPYPRPPVLRLSNVTPPSTVFSIVHLNLLILCPCSSEVDSLAVLEFLHRVVDVLEDFLGAPLLANKIENNYDVVAQLMGELCDGGIVCNTEGNALRESVEVSSLLGKLFNQVGLPGAPASLGSSSNNLAATLKANTSLNSGPAIPWRRPNVRHTSNELYVDILESISIILAPSGRPISATAAGSIAFTAKISGVPDLLLTLTAPGGTSTAQSSGITRTMALPVFHPCVRLARWNDSPGTISFVPPDGRFMLAGYEVDLLPSPLDTVHPPSQTSNLFLPAIVSLRTGLGPTSSDFEARLTLSTAFPGFPSTNKFSKPNPRSTQPFSFGPSNAGSSTSPTLDTVSVTVPFPTAVRSVTELKASRGEANYNSRTAVLTWKIPTKDGATVSGTATLTGTVAGPMDLDNSNSNSLDAAASANAMLGYYDEDSAPADLPEKASTSHKLMPKSATVSFSVRGWLPSGIKVDSLTVDAKKSKGLGEGVKPFKGVKYITVSRQGVERRV